MGKFSLFFDIILCYYRHLNIAVVIVKFLNYRSKDDDPEVPPEFGYLYQTMNEDSNNLEDPSKVNNGLDVYGKQFFKGDYKLETLSKGTVYAGSAGSSTLLHCENGGLSFLNKEYCGVKVSFYIPRSHFEKVCACKSYCIAIVVILHKILIFIILIFSS